MSPSVSGSRNCKYTAPESGGRLTLSVKVSDAADATKFALATIIVPASGEPDTNYGPGSGGTFGHFLADNTNEFQIFASAADGEGGIYVGGEFKPGLAASKGFVAHLDGDGKLDTQFASGKGIYFFNETLYGSGSACNMAGAWTDVTVDPFIRVESLAVTSRGGRDVYVGFSGYTHRGLFRLNKNGEVNTNFKCQKLSEGTRNKTNPRSLVLDDNDLAMLTANYPGSPTTQDLVRFSETGATSQSATYGWPTGIYHNGSSDPLYSLILPYGGGVYVTAASTVQMPSAGGTLFLIFSDGAVPGSLKKEMGGGSLYELNFFNGAGFLEGYATGTESRRLSSFTKLADGSLVIAGDSNWLMTPIKYSFFSHKVPPLNTLSHAFSSPTLTKTTDFVSTTAEIPTQYLFDEKIDDGRGSRCGVVQNSGGILNFGFLSVSGGYVDKSVFTRFSAGSNSIDLEFAEAQTNHDTNLQYPLFQSDFRQFRANTMVQQPDGRIVVSGFLREAPSSANPSPKKQGWSARYWP